MTDHHDFDLLAAYALDAVDPAEADAIERHLETCARCRRELAGYREVTSLLAYGGGDAPPELWDRIAAGMHDAPPAEGFERIRRELWAEAGADALAAAESDASDEASAGSAAPSDAPSAGSGAPSVGSGGRASDFGARGPARIRRGVSRRPSATRRWRVPVALVAAAAVAAIAVLGVRVAQLSGRPPAAAAAAPATMADVRAALAAPGHRTATLLGQDAALDVVILRSGVGYVYDANLRRLPPSRTYQLWGVVGSQAISYGLLGPDPRIVEFRAGRGLRAMAVTDEVSTGVVVTHQPFTVSGSVPPV